MPKITIVSVPHDNRTYSNLRLAVDGVTLSGTQVVPHSIKSPDRKKLRLTAYAAWKQEDANIISGLPLSKLRELFISVITDLETQVHDFFGRVELIWEPRESEHSPVVIFWPTVLFEDWARPYSIAELSDAIQEQIESHPERGGEFFIDRRGFPQGTPNFAIVFPIHDSCETILDLVKYYSQQLEDILEQSVQSLLAQARRDSIVTFFEFPKGVRTACQQYLVYFVQFLADLGIDADAELKEDAQHILFSVTPRDGTEALERIQEALQVFLSLPGSAEIKSYAITPLDIATQQLAANVMHLESQLTLARATEQLKDVTIEKLQLMNFQYRQMLLTTSPSAPSPQGVSESDEPDREEFFDGTLVVTPYKGKGFEVNIPKLIQKLRRRFS